MKRFFTMLSLFAIGSACLLWAQEKKEPDLFTRLKNSGIGDKPFTLIVSLQLKEGVEKKFIEEAEKAVQASLKESGCITYEFHQDLEHPTKFVLFEKWKNVAALEAHFKETHTQAILKVLGDVSAAPPQIQIAKPTSTVTAK